MERDTEIEGLFKSGETLQAIGNQFGISRERVRQILAKRGIRGAAGGVAVSRPRQRAMADLVRRSRWLPASKFGSMGALPERLPAKKELDAALENADEVTPDLIRCASGDWLAVAPKGAILPIGVTAKTEEDVREKFRSAYQRSLAILETGNLAEST